jgi:peptidoglycan L-alanyl-D-glutamate endopeptidase CwlK
MAFKYGKRSLTNIAQCHPDLQKIAAELIKEMDVTVICGHRGKDAQNKALRDGTSKLPWPKSKHNSLPSRAMDVCPSPINWEKRAQFLEMRERMKKIAARLGIKVRFISWDLPHIELA